MITLPRLVYESLPYVYAGAGLVSAAVLDTLTGRMSGILLVTAAAVIGYQRYEFRRQQREKLERLVWLQEQEQKHKQERQAWLRQQADLYRDKIKQKEEDF